jgi:hypothetical protein
MRKGTSLENSSWEEAFQENYVEDRAKRSARMMHIRDKLMRDNPIGIDDPPLRVKSR